MDSATRRRILLSASALTLAVASAVGRAAVPEAVVPRATGRITVDGSLSEWTAPHPLDLASGDLDPRPGAASAWSGPGDSAASILLCWDDDCLYVGGRVKDDRLVVNPGSLFLGDSIEVFLRIPAGSGKDDYQLILSPLAEQTRWEFALWRGRRGLTDGGFDGVQVAGRADEGPKGEYRGYSFEAAIPLANFPGFDPVAGGAGINIAVVDADEGPGQESYCVWSGRTLPAYDPSAVAPLRFEGAPAPPARRIEGAGEIGIAQWKIPAAILAGTLAALALLHALRRPLRRLGGIPLRRRVATALVIAALVLGVRLVPGLVESHRESRASERLADAADAVLRLASEAEQARVLVPGRTSDAGSPLVALVEGRSVPSHQEYRWLPLPAVPAEPRRTLGTGTPVRATQVPLAGAGRAVFRLAEPLDAEALCVVASWRDPAEGRTGPPPGTVVGRVTALGTDGSAESLDLRLGREVDDERSGAADSHGAAESKVAWRAASREGHADEIRWKLAAPRRIHSLEAEQVVSEGTLTLRGVTVFPPAGGAPAPLPLGRTTREGVPTGSWNGGPPGEVLSLGPAAATGRIPVGEAVDALVVIYGCPGGPPADAAGRPVASLRPVFEDGRAAPPALLAAGVHVDAESLARDAHPEGFLAGLAYRWPGPAGDSLHRDSLAVETGAPGVKVKELEVSLLAPGARLVVDAVVAGRRVARPPTAGLSLLARDGDAWVRSAAAASSLDGVAVTHYRGGRAVASTLPAELRDRVLGTEAPPEIRPEGSAAAPGRSYYRNVGGRSFLARQARLPARDADDVLEAAVPAPSVADLDVPIRAVTLLLLALLLPLALSAAIDLLGFLPRLHGKLVGAFAVAAVLPLVGFTLLLARHFEAGVDRGLEGELRAHADAAARALASRRDEARRLAAESVRDEALLAALGAADDAAGAGRVDAALREIARRAGSARVSLEAIRGEGAGATRRTFPSRETPAPFQGLYEPADGLDFRWSRLWATGVASHRAGPARLRLVVEVPVDDRSLEDVRRAGGDRAHVLLFSPDGYPVAGTADLSQERSPAAAAERRAVADDLRRAPGEPEVRARLLGGLPHVVAWDLLRAADGRAVGILAVAVPRPAHAAAALGTRDLVLLLGSVALLVAVVVANLVARRVADPVEELARAAGRIGQGDLRVRASESGGDEIASLGAAFNRMTGQLEGRIGELSRLHETMAGFSGTLDRAQVLGRTLAAFRESARPAAVLVVLADRDADDLEVAAGLRGEAPVEPRRLPASGFLGAALRDATAREAAIPSGVGPAERELLGDASRAVLLPLTAGAGRTSGAVVLLPGAEPAGSLDFLAALARQAGIALENARLYRLAVEDPSTGLSAASYFRRRLQEEIDRAVDAGRPVSLVLLAVEGAAAVFEKRGPAEGNALLRAVGERIRGASRAVHVLARTGREGLALLLPEMPRPAAEGVAESLRAAVEGTPFATGSDGREARVGLAFAVATAPDDARSAEFLENEAVRALERAREERRGAKPGAAPARPGVDRAEAEALGFRSAKSLLLLDALNRIAAGDVPVLVLGETGVGKEVVADVVHAKSRRAAGPLVKVNCAALPGPLLEAELFGHEKGAFTGADRRRPGRFELAHGGTLFLDEIGELPPALQVKLLRVLQDGKVERLGGTGPVEADVRVVAATNRDLPAMIEAGTFREDLYYRLNVLSVVVPPLRARREDIPPLADRFLADARAKHGSGPTAFSPEALDLLFRHPFPGNVRQLRNMVERAVVAARGPMVTPADLSFGEEPSIAQGTVPPRRPSPASSEPTARGGTVPGVDSGNVRTGDSPLSVPTRSRAESHQGDSPQISPRASRLLESIRRQGSLTNRRWCEEAGLSSRTGLRDFEELMGLGLVVRTGKRRSASYAAAK